MDNKEIKSVKLYIENAGAVYEPQIKGDIKWSTEKRGTPGKLELDIVKDSIIDFQEGNPITLYYGEDPVFFGFVFQKKRNKNGIISVVAYDQLRYLKNKDTIIIKGGTTASDFIKSVCEDYNLTCGEISDTGYGIEEEIFDGDTLFDMFQKTLDYTLAYSGKDFVLYDDFGKITLKNIFDMRIKFVIDESNIEDFDYMSGIDGDTYNRIKILYSNDKEGTRVPYGVQSEENIKKWGILQYYEKAKDTIGLQKKAETLLKLYNKKGRTLSVKNCEGDTRVRGGSGVLIYLNLGDIIVGQYFLCESVTHSFKENIHLMDIKLRGSDFIV